MVISFGLFALLKHFICYSCDEITQHDLFYFFNTSKFCQLYLLSQDRVNPMVLTSSLFLFVCDMNECIDVLVFIYNQFHYYS